MSDTKFEKIPPQDLDAEGYLLGAILIDPNMFDEVSSEISFSDFYKPANQIIYKAMGQIRIEAKEIDSFSLQSILSTNGDYDKIGGDDYIKQLVGSVPSLTNYKYCIERIKSKSTQRKMLQACYKIEEACYTEIEHVRDFLSLSESQIFDISNSLLDSDKEGLVHIREIVPELRQSFIDGEVFIKTSYSNFDKDLGGGIPLNAYIIIAARPSMGKTALALTLMRRIAKFYNLGSAIFSLETGKKKIGKRMLKDELEMQFIGARKDDGNGSKVWEKIEGGLEQLSKYPIFISTRSRLTPEIVESQIRKTMKLCPNLKLIFIDYLQLMTIDEKIENRQQEISRISQRLRSICQKYAISMVVLSQLNREVEKRPRKIPVLSDLRESGSIEQDADIVILMNRPSRYSMDAMTDEEKYDIIVNGDTTHLIIAKNKDGSTGSSELLFFAETQTFKSKSSIEENIITGARLRGGENE